MSEIKNRTIAVAATILLFSGLVSAVSPASLAVFSPDVSHGSQGTTSGVISTDVSLGGNLTVGNLTVTNSGFILTNGYSIICTGNFTNYGIIDTGASETVNFTDSYGGSGGGAFEKGNSSLANTTGYRTSAPGGRGAYLKYASTENGSTPSAPQLSSYLISGWYSNGISRYLSGGSGEGLPGVSPGKGANGIYIQANEIVNRGIISADGVPSSGLNSKNYSGGGGGGVILLSYSSLLIAGDLQTKGSPGSVNYNNTALGGYGGSGQILKFNFSENPPVKPASVPSIQIPEWAFAGAYFTYSSLSVRSGVKYHMNTTYYITYLSVTDQTFGFSENNYAVQNVGQNLPVITNKIASYEYASQFPAFSSRTLGQLSNNRTNALSVLLNTGNWSLKASRVHVKVGAGSFNTYEFHSTYNLVGRSSSFRVTSATVWVDMSSGLLVKSIVNESSTLGKISTTVQLQSTNAIQSNGFLMIAAFSGAVAAGSITIFLIARAYSPGRSRGGKPRDVDTEIRVTDLERERALDSRLTELRLMLEKGLISEDYYNESINRLKPGEEEENQ